MKEKQPVVKRLLLMLSLLYFGLTASAQKGWELGGILGGVYYFGDLNTQVSLRLPGPTVGVLGRYNFNRRTAMRYGFNFSYLLAHDRFSRNVYERARNLSFVSPVVEGQALLEFNFLPFVHGSDDNLFSPYILGGFSVFYFNPRGRYEGEWVNLQPLGTEGQLRGEEYAKVSAALVYGGGLKLSLSYRWTLFGELMARTTFTDYLDDVSTTYPDMRELMRNRGEVAVAMSDKSKEIPGVVEAPIGEEGLQRGDSRTRDQFVGVTIGLTYYFGSLRCPNYGKGTRR